MNVYPLAATAALSGQISVLSTTVRAQLVGSGYTYSAAHEFFSSVGGGTRIGSPTALSSKTVTSGQLFADPVAFGIVAAGSTITAVVLYQDSGVEATSRLLAYIDRRSDTVPLSVATTGGTITLDWLSQFLLKI